VESAHWYLLPMVEWLIDNWDALFHEERLPLTNIGLSAAEAMRLTRIPPVSLKDIDEFQWLDTWAEWWSRHCIRSSRAGGLFPDLYFRRYRDRLEISTGAEQLLGIPEDFVFLSPNRRYAIDPYFAAEALFTVLTAGARELRSRMPSSQRFERLEAELADLRSPSRETARIAWLAGLGDDVAAYSQVATDADLAASGGSRRRGVAC
jgi:hypothetical protein